MTAFLYQRSLIIPPHSLRVRSHLTSKACCEFQMGPAWNVGSGPLSSSPPGLTQESAFTGRDCRAGAGISAVAAARQGPACPDANDGQDGNADQYGRGGRDR